MNVSGKTICDELEDLIHESHGDSITLGDIVHRLRERGFAMLMLVLVLPNCVPIPIPPGISTLFSLPLLFLTAQMLWGRAEPWMPEKLAKKHIKLHYLRTVVNHIIPYMRRIQKCVKPRFSVASSKVGERFIGLCWFIFALSIAVPMPMTNFLPGIGILISAFGLIGRDGYIMVAGLIIGIGGVLFTTLLLILGGEAIKILF